jgi:hypothetical protein
MMAAHGVLYVIDLAGSERAADTAGHSKERMEETKQINLSLMALKECIRARTLASQPGQVNPQMGVNSGHGWVSTHPRWVWTQAMDGCQLTLDGCGLRPLMYLTSGYGWV